MIAARKIRDDDAEALQFQRGGQQVRDGVDRDVRERAAADGLRDAVTEIGRQLVEQDQGRLVADEVDPVLLVRRLRAALVEFDEIVGLAQLLGDVAPQVLVAGDRAARDRDDARRGRREALRDFLGNEMREAGIGGEVAEGEHGVRLAATHGLLEFEDGLSRDAGETLESLPQQGVHAAGDVGLPEERLRGAGVVADEILEALDLVAERVVDRLGVELAGVLDRLQHYCRSRRAMSSGYRRQLAAFLARWASQSRVASSTIS